MLRVIDDSNEWLLGTIEDDSDDDDLVFEGDTLTWAAVTEACDANESRYSTRRRALLKFKEETKERLPLMPLILSLSEFVFS